MMGNPHVALSHLYMLEDAFQEDIKKGQLLMKDLGWCEEVNSFLFMKSSLIFPSVICYSFFQEALCWTRLCHSRLLNTILQPS